MQCGIMAVEEPRSAVGPMAFWNLGIAHQTIWTAKKVTVRTDDGTDVIMTKRGRCLRYIIKRFQTGVVDCGLHETDVEGLERELKNIADGCAPPPAIQIHRRKSDLFLHTDRVELERFEWRPLFPDDRLRNDTRGWKSQGKDDAASRGARRVLRVTANWQTILCCLVFPCTADGGHPSSQTAQPRAQGGSYPLSTTSERVRMAATPFGLDG